VKDLARNPLEFGETPRQIPRPAGKTQALGMTPIVGGSDIEAQNEVVALLDSIFPRQLVARVGHGKDTVRLGFHLDVMSVGFFVYIGD